MAKAREAAFELDRSGYASLALALDDGLDRVSVTLVGNSEQMEVKGACLRRN